MVAHLNYTDTETWAQ